MKFVVYLHEAPDKTAIGIIVAPTPRRVATRLGITITIQDENTGFYSSEGSPLPGEKEVRCGEFISFQHLPEIRFWPDIVTLLKKLKSVESLQKKK